MALHCASVGFWLPCYQTSFFHPGAEHDHKLLPENGYYDNTYELPLHNTRPGVRPTNHFLEDSIYRRLLYSMFKKGYEEAYVVRNERTTEDPSAILFLCRNMRRLQATSEVVGIADELPYQLTEIPITLITCCVNVYGFYVWTAQYESQDMQTRANLQPHEQVEMALKRHVSALVGGSYFSHIPGTDSSHIPSANLNDDVMPDGVHITIPSIGSRTTPRTKIAPTEKKIGENLIDYRDTPVGILTFFQINTILEGLYNANLDFRVFFGSESANNGERESPDSVSQHYSLGRFVKEILTGIDSQKFKPEHVSREKKKDSTILSLTEEDQLTGEKHNVRLNDFCTTVLSLSLGAVAPEDIASYARLNYRHAVREEILAQFLHKTSFISLQRLKKHIERCRRALLEEVIEVTHRRNPIRQLENPDPLEDRIEGVNEHQLRGYFMLFAAKLPLLNNVYLHLKDLQTAHQDVLDKEVRSVAHEAYETWETLLEALTYDVNGLRNAIDQAQSERLVYEEEQIHSEQETIAELERLRERQDNSLSSGTVLSLSIISNVFALVAVVVGIITLSSNNLVRPSSVPGWILTPQNLLILGKVLGQFLLLALALYLFFQYVIGVFIHNILVFWRRVSRSTKKYYYELDIQVGSPARNVTSLFERDSILTLQHEFTDIIGASLPPIQRFWQTCLAIAKYGISKVEREKVASIRRKQSEASADNRQQRKVIDDKMKKLAQDRAKVQQQWDQLRQDSVLYDTDKFLNEQDQYMRNIEQIETDRERFADQIEKLQEQEILRYNRRSGRLPYKDVERNSYRVVRTGRDEALHKIYIDATIQVGTRRFFARPLWLRGFLVYEIMFHRPSLEHGYIFKSVRFISTHSHVLTRQQIMQLKKVIVEDFTNNWLEHNDRLAVSERGRVQLRQRNIDAIMTLNYSSDPQDTL